MVTRLGRGWTHMVMMRRRWRHHHRMTAMAVTMGNHASGTRANGHNQQRYQGRIFHGGSKYSTPRAGMPGINHHR